MRAEAWKNLRIWICAMDGCAGLLFGGAALGLAVAEASPPALTIFGTLVWLWLIAVAVVGFCLELPPSAPGKSRRAPPCPPALEWAGASIALAALAAVCAVLFAYGLTAPATAAEILFLMRLNFLRRDPDPSRPGCRNPIPDDRWWSVRFEYPLLLGGAVWVALGTPSPWAGAAILTGLWILAVISLLAAAMAHGASVFSDYMQPELDRRFHARFPDEGTPQQKQDFPPEPTTHWLHRALKWPMRIGVLVAAWALWNASFAVLAAVLVAAALSGIAWNVQYRRKNYGPAVRIDPVGRLVHAVLRLPLIGAGLALILALCASVVIIAIPFILLAPLLERCIPWGRERRARDKLLAKRAEGPKLCRAFDRPQGCIYFLYGAPHQYEHFMAEDSVLTLAGLPIIARDWKQDVMPLTKSTGSKAFSKTPEGTLLRYAGVRGARDNVPLAVIVPPVGLPAICRFACAYRTRAANPERLARAERNFAMVMTLMLKHGRFGRHRSTSRPDWGASQP